MLCLTPVYTDAIYISRIYTIQLIQTETSTLLQEIIKAGQDRRSDEMMKYLNRTGKSMKTILMNAREHHMNIGDKN